MKRNLVTLTIGFLLFLIFGVLLFTFQVRQTEVAVVTRFDKPTAYYDGSKEPGLKFKLPRPIQKVYTFDRRIQNFEDKLESALTQDGYNLLISVFAGWTISDPRVFFSSFPSGEVSEAQPRIEDLIRNTKLTVAGKHPFSHFISTDPSQLKFTDIEKTILDTVRPIAEKNYGVTIQSLGIKKLGLPESVTQKVFERMAAEREQMASELRAKGDAAAISISSKANYDRNQILADAESEATRLKGEADAETAKSLAVFEKNAHLAILLRKLAALEDVTKDRTTLILDPRTPPFDLFWGISSNTFSGQTKEAQR